MKKCYQTLVKSIVIVFLVFWALTSHLALAAAPAGVEYLKAVPGDAKVKMVWTAVPGATSYKIYSGISSEKYTLPVVTTGNVIEYEITGLQNGTIYYFAMTAVSSGGESINYSYEVKAQPTALPGVPPDFEAPSDVDGISVTAGDAQVTLKWNAATDNAGVTGYNIYYGKKSVTVEGQSYDLTVKIGNVTQYEVKNLINETKYYFAVTALDANGNESIYYSDEFSATPKVASEPPPTDDKQPPSDVGGVSITAGDASITLKWNAATDNVGVTGYNVYYGTESVTVEGQSYDLTIKIGNVTQYEVKSLTNGTKYYFAVTALDAKGNESDYYSDEVSATPKAASTPPPVDDDKEPLVDDDEEEPLADDDEGEHGAYDVAPKVLYSAFVDATTVRIVFSEKVTFATGGAKVEIYEKSSYIPLKVEKVVLMKVDNTLATVTTESMKEGMTYVVTVDGVVDSMGQVIVQNGKYNSAIFTAPVSEPEPSVTEPPLSSSPPSVSTPPASSSDSTGDQKLPTSGVSILGVVTVSCLLGYLGKKRWLRQKKSSSSEVLERLKRE